MKLFTSSEVVCYREVGLYVCTYIVLYGCDLPLYVCIYTTVDPSVYYSGPLCILQWTPLHTTVESLYTTVDPSVYYSGPLCILQWTPLYTTVDLSVYYSGLLCILQWTPLYTTVESLCILQWTPLYTVDPSVFCRREGCLQFRGLD